MARKEVIFPGLARYIGMCDFPISKEQLLQRAEECQFPDEVVDVCEELPNQTFESEEDFMNAVVQAVDFPVPRRTQGAPRRF